MKTLTELSDDELAALARRALASPDAPTAWLQRARGAWAEQPPSFATLAQQALQAGVRRLTAVLSFDSWTAAPLASGLRSLRGETRQLVFSIEGRDIDLRLTAVAERFALAGQVLGPDEAGIVTLALLEPPAPEPQAHSTTLDSLGEFHLDGVAAGRYRLTLQLGADEIVLAPIELGAEPG